MQIETAIEKFKDWEFKQSAYLLAISTINFDDLTIAPKDGANYRNQRLAYLSGEYYSIATDENMVEPLKSLVYSHGVDPKIVESAKKQFKQLKELSRIPKDEYIAFQQLQSESAQQWQKSKATNDYASFEPYLLKVIETQRRFAHYCAPDMDPYDYLLDQYEPGMDQKQYDAFFDLVQKKLVPLIHAVVKHQDKVDRTILNGDFPIETQTKIMDLLKDYLHFDPSWGYMGVSAHPFTNGFNKNDVRVTTAYDLHDATSAIFSLIHEVGHATYEHQLDDDISGTFLAWSISSGMHESQSRLFENNLGRSAAFWKTLYPKLQTIAPHFQTISFDDFIKAINASSPSLIRTEADELTYPIHILIRYTMEKALFAGQLDGKRLNTVWNDYYHEFLGVDVPNDTMGILQDVHWADGSFGYFPTYALGSAIAAQIYATMCQAMDVDTILSDGDITTILEWLKTNIQHDGSLHDFNTILTRATGKPFDPSYYIDYLVDKYTKLYEIDPMSIQKDESIIVGYNEFSHK